MPKSKGKKKTIVVRRQVAPATARASTTKGRRSGNPGVKSTVAAVAGGAVGSLVGGLLVRSGVDVKTAALGMTAAGVLGAFTLNGPAKVAAVGAAAAGAGQVALGWLAEKTTKSEARKSDEPEKGEPKKRQGLPPRRVFEEMRRRELDDELAEEFDAAA